MWPEYFFLADICVYGISEIYKTFACNPTAGPAHWKSRPVFVCANYCVCKPVGTDSVLINLSKRLEIFA